MDSALEVRIGMAGCPVGKLLGGSSLIAWCSSWPPSGGLPAAALMTYHIRVLRDRPVAAVGGVNLRCNVPAGLSRVALRESLCAGSESDGA